MATLKFYLKTSNKNNQFPIFMCYQHKGKKFRFFTRVYAEKSNWQKSKLKPISLKDYEDKNKLDTCENVIWDIERESISLRKDFSVVEVEIMFRDNIKKTAAYFEAVDVQIVEDEKTAQSEFFKYYDRFISECEATKTKGTIDHHKCFKNTLQTFEKKTGQILSFSGINNIFYNKFHNYQINELKILNNTIGSHIKIFKVFLNYAMRNYFTDIKFDFKDFKTIREDVDIISLTEHELFALYESNQLNEKQQIASDYVCFESFTGLRFSDICRLKHENIKEDFIDLRTKKTRDILFVPLNVFAKEILQKYKGQYATPLPPALSNQEINKYIKEAGAIVKINELTMVEKFSGSNRIAITKPKYAFLTTHTGRRTFITLSHEKGMQIEMIMKITGIKKWDTLKKYLKVSEKSKLVKMNEFWNRENIKKI